MTTVSFSWILENCQRPDISSMAKQWSEMTPTHQPQCRVMLIDHLTSCILLMTTRLSGWEMWQWMHSWNEMNTLISKSTCLHFDLIFSRLCAAGIFEPMTCCFTCSDSAQWGGWRAACSRVLQPVWRSTRSFSGKTAAVTGHTPFTCGMYSFSSVLWLIILVGRI